MSDRDLQHPVITNMERTGHPDGKEPDYPRCPVCHAECSTIVYDLHGEISGCDVCSEEKDAWDVPECCPGKEI